MARRSITHHPIGIPAVDEQHDGLAEAIGGIERELRDAHAGQLEERLSRFLELARNHFASEEEHMLVHGYPAFADHRAEHTSLTVQLQALCESATPDPELATKLWAWFTPHAEGADRAYGRWLL